ncbi:hypothetical protein BGX33_012443 [Mortierella sp. NVP41]|nr:hypothetical protein BGX33_012443 [Mortierella sp. NVP41]
MSNNQDSSNNNNNNNNNNDNSNGGSRPIFSLTMDPNALEHEIDQATQALHSTVNSLLNTMQSSVFGGLETLSREMSALEKSSKTFLEDHPFEKYQNQFPWSFRTDGPKKRYRITIEELPPLTEAEIQQQQKEQAKKNKVLTTSTGVVEAKDGEDFTITKGQAGTADEGKTVITASVAPGLLDWLLFTTHEDSFFRRLGPYSSSTNSESQGATIQELKDDTSAVTTTTAAGGAAVSGHDETQKTGGGGRVPALVEKVKQVGTSWEKDARHWWQRKRSAGQEQSSSSSSSTTPDHQHHLFSGTSQSEQDQEEERVSHRWPRGRTWGRSESYSQTTVTRPDGTVEHRTVNTVNGETETVVKIQHPDGSIEETITRQNDGHRHGRDHGHGQRFFQWNNRHGTTEEDNDRERDVIAAVVAEAISAEKQAEFEEQQRQQEGSSSSSRSWSPKDWSRRQGRDDA